MLKFFRKYNKLILVVGGSILMVLFLLPAGAGRMLGAGMSTTVARIDGRAVTHGERIEYAKKMQVIGVLAPELLDLTGVQSSNTDHWMLLVESARRAGLVGGPRDGIAFIPEMAEHAVDWNTYLVSLQDPQTAAQRRANRPQFVQQRIEIFNASRQQLIGTSESEFFVDTALAEARGVFRLLELNNTSTIFSTRAAVELGKRLADTALVSYASVPAGSLTASMEVTPEELEAHFEEYKAVDPAQNPLGIGYLQQDKIDVEWLTIDRIALESRLPLDPIEVNKYWRQNQDLFPGAFDSVRVRVEVAYRRQRADSVIARINDLIRRRLHASTASLPGGRYKELPADWDTRKPSLSDMARELESRVVEEFNLAAGLPVVTHAGPAHRQTLMQLQALEGIGRAYMRLGEGMAIDFPQLSLSVRELAGESRFAVQQGLVHGPMQSNNGSQYYFRVTAVRPSSPPDSLAEVREKTLADVRILRGMERLEDTKDEYVQRALSQGLEIVAGSVLGGSYVPDVEVTRQTVRHAGTREQFPLLDNPTFRDAVMDVAQRLDPTKVGDELNAADRTLAVAVPEAKSLLVVQIERYRPLTAERFRELAIQIRVLANAELIAGEPFETYTFDTLSKRLKFEIVGGSEDSESSSRRDEPDTEPAGQG